MKFRRWMIMLLVVMLGALLLPRVALACSCLPPGTPQEELERADAVFSGRVVSVEEAEAPLEASLDASLNSLVVTLETLASWKGDVMQSVVVRTADNSAACGYPFAVGGEYLVYAYEENDEYYVSLCSRTVLLSEATEDLAALGEGEPYVLSDEPPAPWRILTAWWPVALIAVLLVAVLVFSLVRVRGQRGV